MARLEWTLFAITRLDRVAGRPGPGRSNRIPTTIWANMVQPLTLPPVRAIDSGRPWPSQARWILVLGPLRERPMA